MNTSMPHPTDAVTPKPEPLAPGLYLVGTPIGNLEDITLRALRVLAAADVLACEDTRITRKLFSYFHLPTPKTIVACNDHNEKNIARRLVRLAQEGKSVVYCSDAGMPGISDPGYNLLQAALAANVPHDVIPGPSAVTTAVAQAGIAAGAFTFLGFPPRRDGRLRRILDSHQSLRPALVFYESPRRLSRLLRLAAESAGPDRAAAVCLELTKKFQRVQRGTLADLATFFGARENKGEAVVIIAGGSGEETAEPEEEETPID